MSKLDTNKAPWFDDFAPSKGFQKILYQPGRPVQARELNQMQSILGNQIESFANHIFKNGSKVSNARTSLQAKDYVRLIDEPTVSTLPADTRLVGETSGITATLVMGVDAEDSDPSTLYVVYTSGAIDGVTSQFIPGENINVLDENGLVVDTVTVRCPTCPGSGLDDTVGPTGKGQMFVVDDGIFYFEGMFIEVARQMIIIQKYMQVVDGVVTNFERCKIGLDFIQSIVTYETDSSLLDPSLGYPNSTAPGADRYKVELRLVRRDYDAEDGENFILLCRLDDGMRIEFMKTDSEYADLMDTMAKRTYETNGDYTIRPFRVSFLDSLKKSASDPLGWSLRGNEDQVVGVVTPSIAYVKGYRVETIGDTPVAFDKARDTKKIESFVKHFDGRTYITANPKGAANFPQPNNLTSTISRTRIGIYDGDATSTAAGGTQIGSMLVSDFELVSGNPNNGTGVYRYYVYDIRMTAGKTLADAKSYALSDVGFYAQAVVDQVSNKVEVYNANQTSLIWKLDRDNVKSLRSASDPLSGSISIVVRRKLSGVADANGQLTFTTSANEFFDSAGSSLVGWYVASGVSHQFNVPAVAVFSPTSLTLNLGATAAGATVYVIADILRTNQTEKQKTLTNLTYQTNTAPSANANSVTYLGKADALRLKSVKLFVEGSPETEVADITDEFRLDTGITDFAYGESSVVRIKDSSTPIQPNYRLAINFDYFEHSGTQGYFTINSYDSALNAPDSDLTYATLPTYTSNNNEKFPVASSIDFRPVMIGTDPINAILPANNSTMIFDIEFYLARADLLLINKDGVIYSKKGEPSETPKIPKVDNNAMALYEVWLSPYTYSLKDISTKFIDNRRFTMRDIGNIEKRLVNVEAIVSLNVLEKSAADMSIKDSNGLDRYKNGFIADNFQDFQAADLTNIEWRAGTDRTQRQLRPSFKASNRKLKFNASKSTGVKLLGNVAVLPYTSSSYISNPYATKHLSVNPYMQFNQRGSLVMSPNNDVWTDETHMPEMVIDIDSGVESFKELADAAGVLGTDWGSWSDQNRTILGTSVTTDTVVSGRTTTTTNTTSTTTAITSQRTGTSTTVESRTDTYTIDDIIKDVSLVTYVRERRVEFYATKLKPNTRVYAFFDGQPVSEFCRDIGFQLSSSNSATASALVVYGSPLITDSNGELRGEFAIPGGRFFVGEKKFILTDDPTMSGDADMETTGADAVYFAGGLDVTKQDVNLNVITPDFKTEQVTETNNRTETTTSRESSSVTSNPAPAANTGSCNQGSTQILARVLCECAIRGGRICSDPVAQAFIVDEEIFTDSMQLFFKQVDLFSDRIFVELRNMVNGYPGTQKIAVKYYTPDQILPFISDDSSTPFNVVWDSPVFLEADTQYCFVVGGASPNTRVWVSRLGEEVVNMPGKIVETPPTTEVSFRSLNGTTWNAEQYEQIKYTINRAKFDHTAMSLVFENEHETGLSFPLDENPFGFTTGSTRINVFQKGHGFTVGDRVSITLFDNVPFKIKYTDFVPQIDQVISTPTGRGTISNIVATSVANEYMVTVRNMSGVMTAGQTYTCDALVKGVRDWYLIDTMDTKKPQTYTLNQCYGSVLENSYGTRFNNGLIGGVPIGEINNEYTTGSLGHSVVDVIDMDVYTINVQTPATFTGRAGGAGIYVYNANERYDVFNVTGAYMPFRATESWSMTGIAHGETGGIFESMNYQTMPAISFVTQEDKFLGQPYKVASASNEQINGKKSVEVRVDFNASSEWTTPVVNLDTFSITTVTNRVEWQDAAKMGDLWVDERDPTNGSETYKYVTRTVNLANAANDMHIYVDCYKDLQADFDVYIKRAPAWETQPIDQLPWVKVNNLPKTRSSVDLTDFIEYHIVGSENVVPETVNGVPLPGWTDDNGEPVPFTSFRVKIVGRSKNSSKPPLFKALRIIAVT